MFDFSSTINLPMVWAFLIGLGIFLYVLLDGFDLGVGILFPFAPSDKCRDSMMSSIAPFWDGNETWLVFGGGGLLAAFPLAYSILLPAFYIPIIVMLLGLIMRGIAFEFRFKSEGKSRYFWDYIFHFGSIGASFCQGAILGAFVQGVKVEGRNFSGGPFDWATGFSVMTGVAVVFGYALLGACWLIIKTEHVTQAWSRKAGSYVLFFVSFFLVLVSFTMPLLNENVKQFWFGLPNFYYLFPIPLLTIGIITLLWLDLLQGEREYRPFFLCMGIFLMSYLGLGISIYPWMIPFKFTLQEAAASGPSLSLMLVAVVPLLPLIIIYMGYSYYVFRGKTDHVHKY